MLRTQYGPLPASINPVTGRAELERAGKIDRAPGPRVTPKGKALARSPGSSAPSAYKSKLEAAYAQYLDALKAAGEIDGWQYEPVNFRLPGKKNFYKPDFVVWKGRTVAFYDTKGRNKSDDRSLVKIKTAAGLNPWARFYQVRRIKGLWEERGIG